LEREQTGLETLSTYFDQSYAGKLAIVSTDGIANSTVATIGTVEKDLQPGMGMTIEGMETQEFSVGIFYFLVICIFVFTAIVFMFMFKDKTQKLKKGEKWLFAWILFGVVVATVFGAAQLLHGFLF
jgi:hypothetical protein